MAQEEHNSEDEQNGQPQTSWKKKQKKVLQHCYKVLSSPVSLILALALYSFIGAAIFHTIEHKSELERMEQADRARENVTKSIRDMVDLILPSQNNGSNLTALMMDRLRDYEDALLRKHGLSPGGSNHRWDFWGAFLYSATIYTTIGYGHIAPTGYTGRIATMLYAIIGIPLCLIVLASLGRLFTRCFKWLWGRLPWSKSPCRKVQTLVVTKPGKNTNQISSRENVGSDEELQEHAKDSPDFVVDDNFNLPPLLAIGIVVVYIAIGAAVYGLWEDWSYLEAFYFIFVSVSTIGFGDILPEHPKYFILSSVYVLFGLSLVAMVVNVIMEALSEKIDKAKSTIEHKVAKAISLQELRSQHSRSNSKSSGKEHV